jgi:hypothetical protein
VCRHDCKAGTGEDGSPQLGSAKEHGPPAPADLAAADATVTGCNLTGRLP